MLGHMKRKNKREAIGRSRRKPKWGRFVGAIDWYLISLRPSWIVFLELLYLQGLQGSLLFKLVWVGFCSLQTRIFCKAHVEGPLSTYYFMVTALKTLIRKTSLEIAFRLYSLATLRSARNHQTMSLIRAVSGIMVTVVSNISYGRYFLSMSHELFYWILTSTQKVQSTINLVFKWDNEERRFVNLPKPTWVSDSRTDTWKHFWHTAHLIH